MTSVDAKTKIKRAFIELLSEKDFEKISILDIVRRAGVGRSTYYYHYFEQREVLSDVFEDVFSRFFEMQRSIASETDTDTEQDIGTEQNAPETPERLYDLSASMVDYLLRNNELMKTLFFGSVSKEFEENYRRYFERSYTVLHPSETAYDRYLCTYLCAGQFHLLETLVENGREADRKDMTDLLFDINCLITYGPAKHHEDIEAIDRPFN